MLIEVTEKEAREIYLNRHWESRGMIKYLPLSILVITVILTILVYSPEREWLSLATLIIVASPAVYIISKSSRASLNYAKQQIEEQNPILTGVKDGLKQKKCRLEEIR